MAVYIKLDDAIEAFKKVEADDIERYGCHIIDCFPAEKAIEIICGLNGYIKKDNKYESEN